jgi:hypothetical protein
MESIQTRLALASQRAAGQRSFQILGDHDLPRLEAFFLSFDFDQRRGYFGGGISSQSIRKFCRSIDWNVTTIIARSGPCCLEAIATLVSLPPDYTAVELSIACPLACEQQPIIAELFELAIGALGNRKVIVSRELAHPDLMALVRSSGLGRFESDHVEIDLAAAARTKRGALTALLREEDLTW